MVRSLSIAGVRRRLAVLVALCALLVSMPSRADAGLVVFAGACTMDLRVDFSPSADLSSSPTSLSFAGSGTCVVNSVVTTGSLFGTATTTPTVGWTCAAGVAVGSASFDTEHPSMSPFEVAVVLEVAAGTLSITAHAVPTFSGLGELAQVAPPVSACIGGAAMSWARYSGTFAFEDPTLS